MKLLGIDYGRRKIGLAVSDGKLAEPLKVIRYVDIESVVKQINEILVKEKVEKVVVGISEGEMGKESKEFASRLTVDGSLFIVDLFDETLSSYDAQVMSIESGMGRKKRKEMEDAFAATIMLQSYIDNA